MMPLGNLGPANEHVNLVNRCPSVETIVAFFPSDSRRTPLRFTRASSVETENWVRAMRSMSEAVNAADDPLKEIVKAIQAAAQEMSGKQEAAE